MFSISIYVNTYTFVGEHNSTQKTDSLVSYFWKRIPLHLKHTPREGSQQVLPFNYCSFVSKDVVNENALKVRSQKVVGLKDTGVTMCGGRLK